LAAAQIFEIREINLWWRQATNQVSGLDLKDTNFRASKRIWLRRSKPRATRTAGSASPRPGTLGSAPRGAPGPRPARGSRRAHCSRRRGAGPAAKAEIPAAHRRRPSRSRAGRPRSGPAPRRGAPPLRRWQRILTALTA
jgi:hypothetical protein